MPAPCPKSSNISLWNILRNNIGKDLSKVAMPVELNEPLNTLQRLCEELEYSELLDKAAQLPNAVERMVSMHPATHWPAFAAELRAQQGSCHSAFHLDCSSERLISQPPPLPSSAWLFSVTWSGMAIESGFPVTATA